MHMGVIKGERIFFEQLEGKGLYTGLIKGGAGLGLTFTGWKVLKSCVYTVFSECPGAQGQSSP